MIMLMNTKDDDDNNYQHVIYERNNDCIVCNFI